MALETEFVIIACEKKYRVNRNDNESTFLKRNFSLSRSYVQLIKVFSSFKINKIRFEFENESNCIAILFLFLERFI